GERRLFRPRQRRIDELERQVAELQRVLRGEAPPAAAAEGGNPALDEAPTFEPDQVGPVEVEIPAEVDAE
ncbi:MAG: hypothetical protein AAGF31_13485, partial [Planctomycetota bacterium]